MTTAGHIRSTVARATCDVSVAGVPWPAYKVIALLLGALVALIVAVAATSAAPAVLAGAAAGTIAWLGLGVFCSDRR